MEKICYVVGAGEFYNHMIDPGSDDYVIAVDNGFNYLMNMGVRIDLVVGDFDSYGGIPIHPNVVVLKQEKNETDMLAAINIGKSKGYKNFCLYGGIGGRISHTIANIQCLHMLSQEGLQGFMYGDAEIITVITDSQIDFGDNYRGFISVFSLSEKAEKVSIKNLKYEIENQTLTNKYPIGISNEFIGKKSSVSVGRGSLLIIYEFDDRGRVFRYY
ncbi:MAG: thiamine diphosphokinase [Bacilli bacterium]|jgi:thiamine pyrophosphokinase